MATVIELVAVGKLVKVDAQLGPNELEERRIFLLPETVSKATELCESMESEWDTTLSPAEQLDELFYHFVSGGRMDFPRQLKELDHIRDGIWRLKTADLRLFGWFPAKDCFICAYVVNANELKRGTPYSGYCEQTWFKRHSLELNEPKFIVGQDPRNVISNCYSTK